MNRDEKEGRGVVAPALRPPLQGEGVLKPLIVKRHTIFWLTFEGSWSWSRRLPARSFAPVVTFTRYLSPRRRPAFGSSVALLATPS